MAGKVSMGYRPRARFQPPQGPTTQVINGRTYLGRAKPEQSPYGTPQNQSYGAGTIWGEDGSSWTPMEAPVATSGTNQQVSNQRAGTQTGQTPYGQQRQVQNDQTSWEQTQYDRQQAEQARADQQGQTNSNRSRQSSRDAQIQALIAAMNGQSGDTEGDVALPDFSGLEGEQQQLQSRLSDLLAGRGIEIGDVSGNAEARANRVATERSAGQMQASEAERLAASGMTSSGDSDARNAQIREQSGQQMAGFNAGLAGRLRGEAQAGAIAGVSGSLGNLNQRMSQQQALFSGRLAQQSARRQASQAQRQQQMQLLQALMAQQGSA